MDRLEIIWKNVLGVLEKEVSEANYLTLFKNSALLSLEDDTATIAAPSAIIINFIEKRYRDIIKKAFQIQLGKDINIVFVPKMIVSKEAKEDKSPLFRSSTDDRSKFIGHLPRVRPDYTFENLAVSSSNQLAYTSALAVAKKIGTSYNPLFIYGPTGVGKTHLMQAIANDAYQKDPSKKIIYITSEEFTNEVVEAIRTNQTHGMKKKFRSAFVLIIDDVQFIAGKDKVQEELFHTFNILIDNGSQIVLSSDRPPSEIKKLEARLSSRFSGGLTVDVEPPDFELKTAILLIKSKKYNITLPIEVAKIIAEHVQDTRSLEGALLRIITESASKNMEINEDFALKTLNKKDGQQQIRLHPDDIINHVCSFYRVKSTQLKGPKRDASLVKARQITMFLLKKELMLTYVEIGNILGGRDHTTVIHGVGKVENLLKTPSKIMEDISGITKYLRG